MFITNITKSSEYRVREAIISKVLLYLNDITVLLERLLDTLERIGGLVAKNFFCIGRRGT